MDKLTEDLIQQNNDFMNNEKKRLQEEFEIMKGNLQKEIVDVEEKNYLDITATEDVFNNTVVDTDAIIDNATTVDYTNDNATTINYLNNATTVDYANDNATTINHLDNATTVDYNVADTTVDDDVSTVNHKSHR